MIKISSVTTVSLITVGVITLAFASGSDYSGTWEIDLRSTAERKANAECGLAAFRLNQVGNKITGEHSFATVGCSRLNEGGEGTVHGNVHNGKATLFVTSGRNGAVVRGTAELRDSDLIWQRIEEIKPGDSEEDSPLILDHGILHRVGK